MAAFQTVYILLLLLADTAFFYLYIATKLRHDLHMLQQNSYRNERYRRWRAHNRATARRPLRWLPGLLILGGILLLLGRQLAEAHINTATLALLLIAALLCAGILAMLCLRQARQGRQPAKKPLVMTARAKRLYGAALLIALILPLVVVALFAAAAAAPFFLVSLALYALLPFFSGSLLLIVNKLLQPLEKRINQKYLQEARRILAQRPDLMVIGITGSYGKTSCKMILAAMLSEQYLTLATPDSVNTPLGVTRIIREQLRPIHEVFICEMGAKQAGDIAELCALTQPQTGILTAIGPQHLETFGSEEAVAQTKFELINALPATGLAVLNLGNEQIAARQQLAACRVAGYGLQNQPYRAEDISYSTQGAAFTLVTPQGSQPLISRLLGRHNIENIVGAAAAAAELGLTLPQIARAVRALQPLPHRLQLLAAADYTIIDDAFNANPAGAAAALDVLALLGEGQKILITPGLVELGEKQRQLNRDLAVYAAKICDFIILVGQKQSQPWQEGLQAAGFAPECYAVAADLTMARQILAQKIRPGATVLFENDLPDMYEN